MRFRNEQLLQLGAPTTIPSFLTHIFNNNYHTSLTVTLYSGQNKELIWLGPFTAENMRFTKKNSPRNIKVPLAST